MTGTVDGAPYHHPIAWSAPIEAMPVADLLARTARRVPGAIALDFMGARTRYRTLDRQVDRAAAALQALGFVKGDRLGLFLPNCPQYVIAYYAALRAGLAIVNFSPLYSAEELAAQVVDAGVTTMVTLDAAKLYPTIASVLDTSPLERLIIGSIADALPMAKAMLYRLFKRRERVRIVPDKRHIAFARLLRPGSPAAVAIDPAADIALIQYTGGTTGRPKGALLSHANLTVNAGQVHAIDPARDEADRLLGALPFFHVFAQTAVLNRTILRGGEIVMLPRFDARAALAAIRRRRITAIPGVPTMFAALVDHPDATLVDWRSVRICISGGAPLPEALQQRFEAATGARLIEGYGLTETAGVVSANPYVGTRKPGSIGQPLPGTRILVVDKDDPTRPPPPGEPGELVIEGPQVMRGYLHAAVPDPAAFVEGHLRTGDVGYVDADGFAFIVDRLKDMVVVGGFKVFPSRIEDVLYTHPAVLEALVIAVPDARLGERPKAFVALRVGTSATPDELMALVLAHVGKHERPVAIEIRPSLPKTMIGKLDRKPLVAEVRAAAQA